MLNAVIKLIPLFGNMLQMGFLYTMKNKKSDYFTNFSKTMMVFVGFALCMSYKLSVWGWLITEIVRKTF